MLLWQLLHAASEFEAAPVAAGNSTDIYQGRMNSQALYLIIQSLPVCNASLFSLARDLYLDLFLTSAHSLPGTHLLAALILSYSASTSSVSPSATILPLFMSRQRLQSERTVARE